MNLKTLLIIDDDPDDFDLVVEAMREVNPEIKIYYVSTCDEAMQFVHTPVDLVFLDINMPYYDGFSWLKAIRQKGFKELPVIMYTNSLSPAHIARAYEEGANLYFSKPDSFSKLITSLKKLVSLDWSNPFLIKDEYSASGRYLTFN